VIPKAALTNTSNEGCKQAGLSTFINDEHKSLGSQGVVKRHCYHGIGVAGLLGDNPLKKGKRLVYVQHTHWSVTSALA